MDNFTHSLTGWALGQAGPKTTTRKGLAALILGANMPDIDVFFGSVPWEPLAMHRGFTHGVLGIVLSAPLLFGLLLGLDRWQVARGTRFRSGLELHPLRLLGLCYLGALTHPLLDLQTTYSVQLLSPFSGAWFHADSLFIIDVWLWSLLSLAIAWSRGQEKAGREWRRVPQLAIGAALAYLAFNLGLTETARERVLMAAPDATAIFASPDPILSWRREMVWQEGDCYRRALFTIGEGLAPASDCAPSGMDHPLVALARHGDPALRRFLGWSVLPQAFVMRGGCGASVKISDARYGDRRNSRLSHVTLIGCEEIPTKAR